MYDNLGDSLTEKDFKYNNKFKFERWQLVDVSVESLISQSFISDTVTDIKQEQRKIASNSFVSTPAVTSAQKEALI